MANRLWQGSTPMPDEKLDLVSFQSTWKKLVGKGFGDYDSLSRDERIWFSVQGFIGQASNGGLISFYYNSGAERCSETIEDLRSLDFSDVADLLVQINSLFPGGPSRDINERNAVISSWSDYEHTALFRRLDEAYFGRVDDLEQALVLHILDRKLAIPDTPDTPGAYRPFRSKRPAQ